MNCPIPTCEDKYISETARRIHGNIKDQNGRDLSRTCSNTALRNIMRMSLEKTLKSLLRTLKITNGNKKYQNLSDKGLASKKNLYH